MAEQGSESLGHGSGGDVVTSDLYKLEISVVEVVGKRRLPMWFIQAAERQR